MFFCGFDSIWSLIRLALWFSGTGTEKSTAGSSWVIQLCQFDNFIIFPPLLINFLFLFTDSGIVVTSFIIYIVGTVLSYLLYKDMQRTINDMYDNAAQADEYGGRQYVNQAPMQQQQQQRTVVASRPSGNASAAPANQSSGFKAFSGTGHRLGG